MPNSSDEISVIRTASDNPTTFRPLQDVNVSVEMRGIRGALHAAFVTRMKELGRVGLSYASWNTDAKSLVLPEAAEVLVQVDGDTDLALFEWDKAVVLMQLEAGTATVQIASASDSSDLFRELKTLIPKAERVDDDRVTFEFCWFSEMGVRQSMRRIKTRAWPEVANNYGPSVRAALANLMKFSPAPGNGGGKTIIWHGPAGTGKTTAIKALAREWSEWCGFRVVTDPERFFGQGAEYLMEVINDPGSGHLCLVLEDTGEMLTASARSEVGQGLSRLLNLTDGLIGDGREILILVTTNEPIRTIHPAMRRPGRCLAEIELPPLTTRQANNWLRQNNSALRATHPHTLAELYALLNNSTYTDLGSSHERVGFGAVLE